MLIDKQGFVFPGTNVFCNITNDLGMWLANDMAGGQAIEESCVQPEVFSI